MKYDKCPRCELNYKSIEQQYCTVCQNEMSGVVETEDNDMLCPVCYKNLIDYDEVICKKCARKRAKNQTDND